MSCGLKLLAQCLALKIFKSTEGGESEMISFPSCQSALGECEMIISGLNVVSWVSKITGFSSNILQI